MGIVTAILNLFIGTVKAYDIVNSTNPPNIFEVLNPVFGFLDTVLFKAAPAVLVVMIVQAGIRRIMAADNPKAVQDSTSTLSWAIIGYIAVMGAYFLVKFVASIFGYNQIGDSITIS